MSNHVYKTIFKNTAVLTLGRLFSRIAQFFLFIYAARCLGVNNFGIFSFGYVLVTMFSLFMGVGISDYCVQQLSRNLSMTPKYLGASLVAKFFLTVTGCFLIMGTGVVMGKDLLTMQVLSILTVWVACDNIGESFTTIFESHEKMEYSAVIISLSNFVMALIGFGLLYYYRDVLLFCLAIALGAVLRLGLSAGWCLKKYGVPEFNLDFSFTSQVIKKSIPFAVMTIFVTIYYQVDSVMLDIFYGSEVVGYYNAAYRLIDGPLFISGSISAALFPAVSRLYKERSESLNKLISNSFSKILAIGISIALIISVMAENLVVAIYGLEYEASAQVLPIMIFSVAFIMPATVCSAIIRAIDQQTITAITAGGGVIVNIFANLILIPKYSLIGAAWATLLTEMLMACIHFELVRRYIGSFFDIKTIYNILVLIFLLLLLLYFLSDLNMWIQLIVCIIFSFPLAFVAGIVTTQDLKKIIT